MEGSESHPQAIEKLRRMIRLLGSYSAHRLAFDFVWPTELRALPTSGLASGSATTHRLLCRLTAAATAWCCRGLKQAIRLSFVPSLVVMCFAEAAAAAKKMTYGQSSAQDACGIYIMEWPDDSHQLQACSSLLRAMEMEACSELGVDLCMRPTALQSPQRLFLERSIASSMWRNWGVPGSMFIGGLQAKVVAAWLAAEAKEGHLKLGVAIRLPEDSNHSMPYAAVDLISGKWRTKVELNLPAPDLAAKVEELVVLLHLLHRRKILVEVTGQLIREPLRHSHSFKVIRVLRTVVQLMHGRLPEGVKFHLSVPIYIHADDPMEKDFLVEARSLFEEASSWTSLDVDISCWCSDSPRMHEDSSEEGAAAVRSLLTALMDTTSLRTFTYWSEHSSLNEQCHCERMMHDLVANNTSLRKMCYCLYPDDEVELCCEGHELLPAQADALQMLVRCSPPTSPLFMVADSFGGEAAFAFQILSWLCGNGAEQQLRTLCGLASQVVEAEWEAAVSWVDGPPALSLTPLCHKGAWQKELSIEKVRMDESGLGHQEGATEVVDPSGGPEPAAPAADGEPRAEEKEDGSANADAVAEEHEVQRVAHAIYNDALLRALQESRHAPARDGPAYLDESQLCLRLELSKRGGQADVVEILATAPELEAARTRVEEAGCLLQPPFAGGSFCLFPIADLGQLLEAGPPPVQGKHYVYALKDDVPALQAAFMRLVSRLRPSLRQPQPPPGSRGEHWQQEMVQEEDDNVRRCGEPGHEERLTAFVASWRRDLEEQGLEIIEDVFIGVRPRPEADAAQRAASSAPSDLQSMRCDS